MTVETNYELGDWVEVRKDSGEYVDGVICSIEEDDPDATYRVSYAPQGHKRRWLLGGEDRIERKLYKIPPVCDIHGVSYLYHDGMRIYFCPFCSTRFSILKKIYVMKIKMMKRISMWREEYLKI